MTASARSPSRRAAARQPVHPDCETRVAQSSHAKELRGQGHSHLFGLGLLSEGRPSDPGVDIYPTDRACPRCPLPSCGTPERNGVGPNHGPRRAPEVGDRRPPIPRSAAPQHRRAWFEPTRTPARCSTCYDKYAITNLGGVLLASTITTPPTAQLADRTQPRIDTLCDFLRPHLDDEVVPMARQSPVRGKSGNRYP